MTARSFSDCLIDIGAVSGRRPLAPFEPLRRARIEYETRCEPEKSPSPQTAPDTGSTDFQCGHTLGYMEAMNEAEERFRQERQAAAVAEKIAREAWTAEEGARLIQAIETGLHALDAQLRQDIARLTETWIVQAVEKASIDAFVGEAIRIADQARERSIEVVGRADLAQLAADRIAATGRVALAHPEPASEIQAQITNTLIETRISEILEGLRRCN